MKNKIFLFILLSMLLMSCKSEKDDSSSMIQEENDIISYESTESSQKTEEENKEEFLDKYNTLLTSIDLLNSCSDFVAEIHKIIWKNVGPDKISQYLEWIRDPERNGGLICIALDISMTKKEEAIEIGKKYNETLKMMDIVSSTNDDIFKDINNNYNYNIDDIKEYYLESSLYAEYARGVEGSYSSYSQALDDYKKTIAKNKKAAEIAY